ncbi:MAG TPA: family 20 glycosylhydrolase [Chitinophagaceae bacterium]|nr:family 20 glycosylhydrolase [Chitinophagaceae bacterium]
MISSLSRPLVLIATFVALLCQTSEAQDRPLIFPLPLELDVRQGEFVIDKTTCVVQSLKKGADDLAVKMLVAELADKYQTPVHIVSRPELAKAGKFILLGDISDPFIREYCQRKGWLTSIEGLDDEGYILAVEKENIVVAAKSRKGVLWGLSSLRLIIQKHDKAIVAPQLFVKDAPRYPFRGIKLYLPGKENFQFFKRFIKDFVVLYKYNKIILELNANMRLDKHPELNIGAVEFVRYLKYSRLDRPPGVHMEYQNSSHQDNADGQILEKDEVADLISYMRKFGIEVIPELPSLTHSYYLLAGHRELAENMNQPYPDTYCPLKPAVYKLYFDVLDEYIDVIHPAMIHVGHDEWRMEKDICELCRGKDYGELYANDLRKIHDYLAAKGIKTAIWGDHLLESVTEKDHQTWKSSTGYTYKIPGALRPEQVSKLIPKDILVFNWFWSDIKNDQQVSAFGLKQVYGNLRADIGEWTERYKIKGVLGGAPSSWAASTEFNIGKDQLTDFLGSANLLWSQHYLSPGQLALSTEPFVENIYKNLSGKTLPVDDGSKQRVIDISSFFNSDLREVFTGPDKPELLTGELKAGQGMFRLDTGVQGKRAIVASNQGPEIARGIQINSDVSSILFLHACTREARNDKAYGTIYDFDDTAEPLGFYEIIYEDGWMETIPIRYGVNILDWRWSQRITNNEKEKSKYSQDRYAYKATAVNCSGNSTPVTFFSFEWENPRFGKKIREIKIRPVEYKQGNENAIILLALNISENENGGRAKGTEAQ